MVDPFTQRPIRRSRPAFSCSGLNAAAVTIHRLPENSFVLSGSLRRGRSRQVSATSRDIENAAAAIRSIGSRQYRFRERVNATASLPGRLRAWLAGISLLARRDTALRN
jgi:hypothetical protein